MLPLEIDIDDMSYLRWRLIELRDSLKTGEFQSIDGSFAMFGRFDRTEMLRHHHSLAHGLMLETIKSVIKSIDIFYTSLVTAQEAFDNENQNLRAQMLSYQNAVENLSESSHLPGVNDARDRYRNRNGGDT